MTTSRGTSYKAPEGFYKSYTFDKDGNVFADGKQLNGVQLDVSKLRDFSTPKKSPGDWGSMLLGKEPNANPYAGKGGAINRLSVDDKGNVYADVGAPAGSAIGNGYQGTKPGNQGVNVPNAMASQTSENRVALSGLTMDPTTVTKNYDGQVGDNNAYLRQDQDGLYFMQVNKGNDVVAYAYNAYQQKKYPVAGPDTAQTSVTRRQGGNAGGGAGVSSDDSITLLGG